MENSGTPGAFLTNSPLEVLNSGKYSQVPLLILYDKDEGIVFNVFMDKLGLPCIHSKFEDYVPRCLKLKENDKEFMALAQEIKRFYYGDKEPSSETKREFYNVSYLKNPRAVVLICYYFSWKQISYFYILYTILSE